VDQNKIRGLVYAKYRSAAALGDAIGWDKQKVSRIMDGKQEMRITDFVKFARALDIKQEDWPKLFKLLIKNNSI